MASLPPPSARRSPALPAPGRATTLPRAHAACSRAATTASMPAPRTAGRIPSARVASRRRYRARPTTQPSTCASQCIFYLTVFGEVIPWPISCSSPVLVAKSLDFDATILPDQPMKSLLFHGDRYPFHTIYYATQVNSQTRTGRQEYSSPPRPVNPLEPVDSGDIGDNRASAVVRYAGGRGLRPGDVLPKLTEGALHRAGLLLGPFLGEAE